jgi:hypothetical protein
VTTGFFTDLPAADSFMGVLDAGRFHPAPADWVVVVADVRSSTRAVQQGRYKEVNLVGGAVVCAALNALAGLKVPFVFGGDGATLLVPGAQVAVVKGALVRTRTLARTDFDLDLRIGFVPVADLRAQGKDVLVARYAVSPGNDLAMFDGGGVELADRLIKEDVLAATFAVPDFELPGRPDLTGLSCRWEPLRSQQGSILCVLVRPLAEDPAARRAMLARVLAGFTDVLGAGLAGASPVTARAMRFRWPPRGLLAEARATRGAKSLLRRYAEVLVGSFSQLILERLDLKGGAYDAPVYRRQLRANSDHCRFDDVLRLVLDCSAPQIRQLETLLEGLHRDAEIDYGLFEVRQALMTCLLFSLEAGQHVHFIDGDDGGFWAAAEGYKQRRAARGAA